MEQSEHIDKLAAALVDVQPLLKGAVKDSTNPHFRSSYADLESVMAAIRDPLASVGLAVTQGMEPHAEGVVIVTQLVHKSGQWLRGKLFLRPQKNDPQGIGSCITYGRRYGAAAIVGLHQTDDDGEAGSGRGGNSDKLEPPKRLSDEFPELRPPGPALSLDGELSDEEKFGRLVTQKEIGSLMALLDQHHVSTDALKRFCQERWHVQSRKHLRVGMLPILAEWAATEGRAA